MPSAIAEFERAVIDRMLRNDGTVSIPATIFLGLHLATETANAPAAGQAQVQVDHNVPVGSTVVIDPLGPSPEEFGVNSVAGTGPYILTLTANLTVARLIDTPVSYHPMETAYIREPVGNGYARQALTLAAAVTAGGVTTSRNAADVTFPAASPAGWGVASHFVVWTALSGGTPWVADKFETPKLVGLNDSFSILSNLLTITMD